MENSCLNFIKTNLEKKFPFLKEKNVPRNVMQYYMDECMGLFEAGLEYMPFSLQQVYNLSPKEIEKSHNGFFEVKPKNEKERIEYITEEFINNILESYLK